MYYTWAIVSEKPEQSQLAADSILFIDATRAIIVPRTGKISYCPIASGGSGQWRRSES
jgi:hypothetical protein